MRIVFFGTPGIAVPTLEALVRDGHDVCLVVTQPDRPKGRGRKLTQSPIKECAQALGLPVFQPKSVNTAESLETFREQGPDLFAVVSFGQIFKKPLLDIPTLGCVNVHFSLLPKYRGAAPVQHALMAGEEMTGVTTMFMDEGLDTGDMIHRAKEPIRPDDTTESLMDRLAEVGADLMVGTAQDIAKGIATRIPQDHTQATHAPSIKPDRGVLDWDRPACGLCCQTRALRTWPGCVCWIKGKRVRVWAAQPLEGEATNADPGTIIDITKAGLRVACGEDSLLITEVQPAGKQRMPAHAFANGYRIEVGDRFEQEGP